MSPSLFTINMTAMVRRAGELAKERTNRKRELREKHRRDPTFVSLQFIDDCNSLIKKNPKRIDDIFEQAAEESKWKWDHEKDSKNGIHFGVNLQERRHTKFREGKAKAASQQVRRLTRLPPREKKKIVVSQLLPILMYGCELHNTPTARGEGYAAEWNRFITGACTGSSRGRLSEITGIAQLGEATKGKRIRSAVSACDRGLTELKAVAEKLLRENIEEGTELQRDKEEIAESTSNGVHGWRSIHGWEQDRR